MKSSSARKRSSGNSYILFAVILVFLLLVLPFGISIFIYEQYFGVRYTTTEALAYRMEDYPGLQRTPMPFSSDKGQTLAGYLYYTEDTDPRGIVVIAHGFGGGGHNSYMDCADFFARNGYYAFCYDATGNDESEGSGVGGLPQGVIDLSYAISYIQSQDGLRELPIMLFGHSWGGYSVANVLTYHPEVKAVVSFSGFNQSSDLIASQGEEIVGSAVRLLMPYVNAYEWLKFGSYATNTALDGFETSDAAVFIVHSQDDTVVPQKYGYDLYYEAYGDCPRFTFIHYTDKGHSHIYYSEEAIDYINGFNDRYFAYYETWPENLTEEEKQQYHAAYLLENLDRTIYTHPLDEKLFREILAFYDANLD